VQGDAATHNEIRTLMVSMLQYQQLPASFSAGIGSTGALASFYAQDRVAVFDLHAANVVRAAAEFVVPIDCIPVMLHDTAVWQIARALCVG